MSVRHSDNPQGFFIRRVRNQVIVNRNKAEGARGQIWASAALMRKAHQRPNGAKHVLSNTPSSLRAVTSDKSPNVL
jgi:hypothetical protein